MGRLEYLYDYYLDSSTVWPKLDIDFEIFQHQQQNKADYEAKAFKPERYFPILRTIKGVGVFGSSICIVFNILLIVAILSSKETRNFCFFPVVFQAVIDVLGPGIANIGFEIRSYQQFSDQISHDTDFWGSKRFQGLVSSIAQNFEKKRLLCVFHHFFYASTTFRKQILCVKKVKVGLK